MERGKQPMALIRIFEQMSPSCFGAAALRDELSDSEAEGKSKHECDFEGHLVCTITV
jgi:hypothetical protein